MDHHHYNAHRASLAAPERARVVPAGLAALGAAAAAPAELSPPHKDEAHRLAGAAGFRDQGKADTPDCADSTAGDQPGATDCKRFATFRARLALAGWALIRTEASDGARLYFATRWNMPRELADLAAVEAFADRVGAPR
jgi:hypothetical protein